MPIRLLRRLRSTTLHWYLDASTVGPRGRNRIRSSRLPSLSVQLAAYDAAAPAEALVRRLRSRGIEARVSGTVRPFRVRVGRFATSAEAEREAAALKRRGQSAWVVTETAAP